MDDKLFKELDSNLREAIRWCESARNQTIADKLWVERFVRNERAYSRNLGSATKQ